MTARRAGRAQLLLQLGLTGLGSRILTAQQPFTVGIIDATSEPQPTRHNPLGPLGAAGGKGQLQVENLANQAPGPGAGRLLQGEFQQPVLLSGRQPIVQGHGLGEAGRLDGPKLRSTQQHLRGSPALAQAFQVAGQQIQGRAGHGAAVLPLVHRQLQPVELGQVSSRKPDQRIGGQLMVEARLGSPPLHHQPLNPLSTWRGADPGEHLQGPIGSLTAQQHVGIGQHHGQGLGGGMQAEQPPLQETQPGPIPLLDGHGTGPIEATEIPGSQELGQGRIKRNGLGRRPESGGSTQPKAQGHRGRHRSRGSPQPTAPGGEWRSSGRHLLWLGPRGHL